MMEPPPPYTPSPRASMGISPEVLSSTLSPNITERRGGKHTSPHMTEARSPPFNPQFSDPAQWKIPAPAASSGVGNGEVPSGFGEIPPLSVRPSGLYPRLQDYFPDVTDGEKTESVKACAMEEDPNNKENSQTVSRKSRSRSSGTPFV